VRKLKATQRNACGDVRDCAARAQGANSQQAEFAAGHDDYPSGISLYPNTFHALAIGMHITPRLYYAGASPCSAVLRYHSTASLLGRGSQREIRMRSSLFRFLFEPELLGKCFHESFLLYIGGSSHLGKVLQAFDQPLFPHVT
jgi:hypothetical protein